MIGSAQGQQQIRVKVQVTPCVCGYNASVSRAVSQQDGVCVHSQNVTDILLWVYCKTAKPKKQKFLIGLLTVL